jgi:hypothetical protein
MKFPTILAPNDDQVDSRPHEIAVLSVSTAEARGLQAHQTVFVVEHFYPDGRTVRRWIYSSLVEACSAQRRAQIRGKSARIVAARLVPVHQGAEAAGVVADEFAFAVVSVTGRDRFPIKVYRTLDPASGAVRAAERRGHALRIVFCYLVPLGGLQ